MTDNSAPSFDRMRNMLVRAAEIRESEQQQIFDALDDIYARIAPIDSLGAVRKRLSELPDRTEVSVLAERLDETMSRLEAQDAAIASVARAVDSIVDKLAKPFAELGGRLDGVAGRFEGVAGRMDGLEDKLQNIHRRLDELEMHLDKQDSRMEALPSAVHGPVRERIELAETALRERMDAAEAQAAQRVDDLDAATKARFDELTTATKSRIESLQNATSTRMEELDEAAKARVDELDAVSESRLNDAVKSLRTVVADATKAIDAGERIDSVVEKVNGTNERLDEVTDRLSKVEDSVTTRVGDLDGLLKARLSTVEGAISDRPDMDSLTSVVRKSNEESERRIGGQLDEAMATFAELMLGGGPAQQMIQPTPPPRQPRRTRTARPRNGAKKEEVSAESSAGE